MTHDASSANPLLRKYLRFQSLRHQQGMMPALQATQASVANSARYRWQLVRDRFSVSGLDHSEVRSDLADNDRYGVMSFLPPKDGRTLTPRRCSVAVVIPAYRGVSETRACLDSVLRSEAQVLAEVIVVDDASPEAELSAFFNDLAAAGRIRLLRNKTNLGFVASVNLGMAVAGDHDVVLLNSDTIVCGDWLDRLAAHAQDATVGTVTPFSNNATICSYPTLQGMRTLPAGETVERLDSLFAATNVGRSTDLPTAVGFCMYIKRECLRDVGAFDTRAFKRGYGEENDFCLRATRRGWRHLLAADTFVWHEGEVSFGPAAASLQEAGLEELRRLHPGYLSHVAQHVQQDPARPWRLAVTAARFKTDGRPVILMVTHALDGGTEKHVIDLCRRYSEEARFLILRPGLDGRVRLSSSDPADELDVVWNTGHGVEPLAALIESFGVSRVHIHHTLGFVLDLRGLITRLGVPFDLTVHDFYSICPRVRLVHPGAGYCGGPDAETCRECLSLLPRADVADIELWHRYHLWLLQHASRVICPSRDAAQHVLPFVDGPELVVALHDSLQHDQVEEPRPPQIAPDEPLRVALIGVLSADKGAGIVGECARIARRRGLPVEFSLVGHVPDEDARLVKGADLRATGPYRHDELQARLAQAAPHIVWFPAVWPETYSYTLSEAMDARLPIVVPDIGAFRERTRGREWTWSARWDGSPAEILGLFALARAELLKGRWSRTTSARAMDEPHELAYPVKASSGFYDDDYLAAKKREDVTEPKPALSRAHA